MVSKRSLFGARRSERLPPDLPPPVTNGGYLSKPPWTPWSRRGQTWTSAWSPWKRWSRRPQSVALAALFALLGPGLAIGALHVNDILNADLLPGTLFLRQGPIVDVDVNVTEPTGMVNGTEDAPGKQKNGNWSDAFSTMDFHRTMMNEYLCRSYVAEQILGDMTEPVAVAAAAAAAATSAASLPATTSAALTADRRRSGNRISSTLVVGGKRPAVKPSLEDEDALEDDGDELLSDKDDPLDTKPVDVGDLILSGAVELGGSQNHSMTGPPEVPLEDEAPKRRLDTLEGRSNVPMFRKKAGGVSKDSPNYKKKRRKKKRRKEPTSTRRVDLNNPKDNMLSDEGSSAYKEWLSRSTLLEDIYKHYDHITQASDTSSESIDGGSTTFEGGEVTGYALTPAVVPAVVPAIRPVHSSVHPGISLATSINSFAAQASTGNSASAQRPSSVYGAPFSSSSPSHPAATSHESGPPADSGYGERHPYDFTGGDHHYLEHAPHHHHDHHDHHDHHEHHEFHHEHYPEKGHGKLLSLKDLFDLVLTAIAFLAFGAYVMHLIMAIMMNNQQNMVPMMTMPAATGTAGGNDGAGTAEGGKKRRRRRAAPTGPESALPVLETSPEVLNRAAQKVLATIDAALLAYSPRKKRSAPKSSQSHVRDQDDSDCLRLALCRHNRFSRTVEGPFRVWMPIWSLGLSWVSGRLSPGDSTVASSTLDNLRAAVLGLGNARCHVVYPRCSLFRRDRPQGPVVPPSTSTSSPPSTSTSSPPSTSTSPTPSTSTSSPPPTHRTSVVFVPTPPATTSSPTPPAIVHPKFSGDLIVTRAPTPAEPYPVTRFMPIGIKTNRRKLQRRPGRPKAAGRTVPRPDKGDNGGV